MIRGTLVLALCGASAFAASNFTAPLVGVARDKQQQLHLVYGVAGNFVVRDVVGQNVSNWSFASGGLAKTDKELLLLGPSGAPVWRVNADGGDALLAPANANAPAGYFIPATGELGQLLAGEVRRTVLQPYVTGGRVMALEASNLSQAELAVCRGGELWMITVDLRSGSAAHQAIVTGISSHAACQSPLPGTVVLLNGCLVVASQSELLIQNSAGRENHLPLSNTTGAPPELHQLGTGWVQVDLPGQAPLLIHLTDDGEQLYRLPGAEMRQ